MERIYSIIRISREKNIAKRRVKYILNKKLKYYTKEALKYFNITIIAFGFIIAIVLIKYKPIYKVSISGEEVGYVQNKKALEETLVKNVEEVKAENIDNINITENPEYELKLVDRTLKTNEEEIADIMKESIEVTYKYYDIALNNDTIESVNTIEQAEELVNEIKENNKDEELDLSIVEKYTENVEEVETNEIEIAKATIQSKVTEKIEEEKKEKEEQERIEAMPDVNGIKLAVQPVTGTITSRYGASSSIRKSSHTGLDIAATKGTPIQVVADGTVTFAEYNGSYGYLVKVDHGNSVETWYAHTSKMYVRVGQKVTAGEVVATVGSTGNSTGPHLHFEIRINGEHVNPQEYLYK